MNTMKIKLLGKITKLGNAGDVIELLDYEAMSLLEDGMAIEVDDNNNITLEVHDAHFGTNTRF